MRLWIISCCALLLGGCFNSGDGVDQAPNGPAAFDVELVTEGLDRPWSLAFLPDDESRVLVTERPGQLLLVSLDDGATEVIDGVPPVADEGQGGYATHVGRGELDLDGLALQNFEVLHVATPFTTNTGHFGSRMVFDGDDLLYVTVGDRRERDAAQDLGSHHGKTLRLDADGGIPPGNPFVDDDAALGAIYSYGHRNAQGMAVHPETTRIWLNEHGQQAGDEVNILEEGGNFGWPIATHGREYGSGDPIGDLPHENPETVDPIHYWEDEAFPPSGMAFYFEDTFPGWHGSVFIGGLGRQYLARFSPNGQSLGEEERLLEDRSWRIRDVRVSPHDGNVYVLVDSGNAPLARLVPSTDDEE